MRSVHLVILHTSDLRLRYSPHLFAQEAPEMFVYDEKTNRLGLREGREPPWIRVFHGDVKTDRNKTWLYCGQCKDHYCPEKGQRNGPHVPFRDRASQYNLRPHRRFDETLLMDDPEEQATQGEPEEEPSQEEEPSFLEEESDDGDQEVNLPIQAAYGDVPDLPAPPEMPTLEEYSARWAAKLEYHARSNLSVFQLRNLIPKPIPQLWQDCLGLRRCSF